MTEFVERLKDRRVLERMRRLLVKVGCERVLVVQTTNIIGLEARYRGVDHVVSIVVDRRRPLLARSWVEVAARDFAEQLRQNDIVRAQRQRQRAWW